MSDKKIKGCKCARCGDDVYEHSECSHCEEDIAEYGSCYFAQCFTCDEDLYEMEVINEK